MLSCFTFGDLVESQGLEHVATERTMPGGTGAFEVAEITHLILGTEGK